MTIDPPPRPACPDCGGRWLDNFRFQHATTCPLGIQLDQTRANDLYWRPRQEFDRRATQAELSLLEVFGRSGIREAEFRHSGDPISRSEPLTTHVNLTTGPLPRYAVAGYDPDTDTELASTTKNGDPS